MVSSWKNKKLGELTSYISKGIPPKYVEEVSDKTIRVLNQKCNRNFKISYNESRLHDCSKKKVTDDKLLRIGDVLINSTGVGTAGRVAQLWDVTTPTTFDGHMILLRPSSEIDSMYYGYAIKSLQREIESLAEGSTGQTEINRQRLLDEIVISYPESLHEQQLIGKILYDIDEKIQINSSINDNLEKQTRSIFQSWFIDYEPFGGSLPSDWKQSSLGQIAIIKKDNWSPVKNPNVVVEHYSIPAFDEKHYPIFEISSEIKSNKYLLTPKSVMISKLNPVTKRIWRPLCLTANSVCSTEFIVYEANTSNQRDYLYALLDSVSFFKHLCSHTTGSTNSHQRATPKSTLEFALHLPSDNIIEDFCRIVTPMYDLIATNIVENQLLAKTRDVLLPLLMSGKLKISDIDF